MSLSNMALHIFEPNVLLTKCYSLLTLLLNSSKRHTKRAHICSVNTWKLMFCIYPKSYNRYIERFQNPQYSSFLGNTWAIHVSLHMMWTCATGEAAENRAQGSPGFSSQSLRGSHSAGTKPTFSYPCSRPNAEVHDLWKRNPTIFIFRLTDSSDLSFLH